MPRCSTQATLQAPFALYSSCNSNGSGILHSASQRSWPVLIHCTIAQGVYWPRSQAPHSAHSSSLDAGQRGNNRKTWFALPAHTGMYFSEQTQSTSACHQARFRIIAHTRRTLPSPLASHVIHPYCRMLRLPLHRLSISAGRPLHPRILCTPRMSVTGAPIKGLTDRDVQALKSRPRAEAVLKVWWVRTRVKLMGLGTGWPRLGE